MTTVQRIALVFGVVFIIVALAGFFTPGGTTMNADMETAPLLFGVFPVNLLHNIVHLLFGLWGLAASRSWGGAVSYAYVYGPAFGWSWVVA